MVLNLRNFFLILIILTPFIYCAPTNSTTETTTINRRILCPRLPCPLIVITCPEGSRKVCSPRLPNQRCGCPRCECLWQEWYCKNLMWSKSIIHRLRNRLDNSQIVFINYEILKFVLYCLLGIYFMWNKY